MLWRRFTRVNDKYSDLNEKEENLKEKFRQALTSTIKVISDDYKPSFDKKNRI